MPSPTSSLPVSLRGISSMATRQLLAELAAAYTDRTGIAIAIESVGGVDAAKRVQAGEPFDVVFLASDAIDKLVAAGRVLPGSKVDLVHSGVAVAVRAGTALPNIASEDAVRQAVLAAPSLSYSTGPSGVALAKLFERWGIADAIQSRIVQAPPGVPVGTLVAHGEVALGFQQLSELIHVDGIAIVGALPAAIQITTTFSAGVCSSSTHADAVRDLLAFMASADAAEAKQRQGMEPA
ncbi:substrate-binding domain-containing protein [Rhodoferax saidenbachensis]|uniref:Molybdate transport system substrate-binding protein n=1 Tax=Rhodoferax saidenbachensis TaxID=1484693 RepID=A0ABU1ZLA7_9BURK|nr:substrate-binding domain-containing protein [Rhodoferax saidenbachensis]MDR7306168.1 molybdate transport system substrate-binding protein [Rhodoferax saidenbachensis]